MVINVGTVINGRISGITKFGIFVEFEENKKGLVHISEISDKFVKDIGELYKVGETVAVKVLNNDNGDEKISLSIKQISSEGNISRGKKPDGEGSPPDRQPRNSGRYPRNDISISQIPANYAPANASGTMEFEEMMAKFKKNSAEKLSDVKKSVESKQNGYSLKKNTKKNRN